VPARRIGKKSRRLRSSRPGKGKALIRVPFTSRDVLIKNQDGSAVAPREKPHNRPQSAGPADRPLAVPANLTIPAGTVIFARTAEPLSSDHNQGGDTFSTTLEKRIVVDLWVVARRSETILGSVTAAQKAGRIKGVSQLRLELTGLTMVDGQQLPILTSLQGIGWHVAR
jgi:hypothetical protein